VNNERKNKSISLCTRSKYCLLESSKPTKQNSKITKVAYPDEKKNNQPVHYHLIKNKTNNWPVQKKGKGEMADCKTKKILVYWWQQWHQFLTTSPLSVPPGGPVVTTSWCFNATLMPAVKHKNNNQPVLPWDGRRETEPKNRDCHYASLGKPPHTWYQLVPGTWYQRGPYNFVKAQVVPGLGLYDTTCVY